MVNTKGSGYTYYYDQLSNAAQKYYLKVLNTLQKCGTAVDADATVREEDIEPVLLAISYDHPELFYVNFLLLRYTKTSRGVIYRPSYHFTSPGLATEQDRVDKAVRSIIREASAAGAKTAQEFCRYFHNYLVKNVKYNDGAVDDSDLHPDAFHCFGPLIKKQAVCEGIAKAFKLLCDRVGVRCLVVVGEANLPSSGQKMGHAWNCVLIGHRYAHIDVTWDMNVSDVAKSNRYDYFCMADQDISADHVFSDYPACTDAQMSYFVQTNRLFSNVPSLKAFLEAGIRNKEPIIYFKITADDRVPKDLHDKIQRLVIKMLDLHCTSGCSYQTIHNLQQNIFYYKFQW